METVDLWLSDSERMFLGEGAGELLERRRCLCFLLLILLLMDR